MNSKSLVRLSNIIGITSILLLVYWVFIFISITVFGFKVFRENLTESFYLSIVGILALMFGALIINIMFNLTRIAENHNQNVNQESKKTSKKLGLIFILSFPLIFVLLFGGDYLSSHKKEKMLVASAKSIIEDNAAKSNQLAAYSFDKKWIRNTASILKIYSKTDTNFPNVSVIVADTLDQSKVFLGFNQYFHENNTTALDKKDYIQEASKEERDYLSKVFYNNSTEIRFNANDGKYQLFYPYSKNGKKIVLYFSEYQRYGKIGS
ncbi:hypothetical protein EV144_103547 [Flavobacterium sp. 270]|uniref:peptidase n=1 Tax=Flavobacterium sp. 270 TaxID=2512114 RepID=UPI001065732A|nr:peptidase [Flavobacterium sp. 270]TDW49022.1 hypothetical protein EV144_103547 [Flavobacterium sp. 270]